MAIKEENIISRAVLLKVLKYLADDFQGGRDEADTLRAEIYRDLERSIGPQTLAPAIGPQNLAPTAGIRYGTVPMQGEVDIARGSDIMERFAQGKALNQPTPQVGRDGSSVMEEYEKEQGDGPRVGSTSISIR